MEYLRITEREAESLKALQIAYKREIGEEAPTDADFERLLGAIP